MNEAKKYWDAATGNVRSPRRLETKQRDGRPLGEPESGWTPDLLAMCGLIEIAETAPPAITETEKTSKTVELVGDIPTEVWTVTPKTQAELDADAAAEADRVERQQLRAMIQDMRTFAQTANGDITAAQVKAQTKKHARILARLMRDALGEDD